MRKRKQIKFDKLPEDANIFPYKVYFSAKVRGRDGDKVDKTEMADNIQRGQDYAMQLKFKFPNWQIYIPHAHEEFVQKAWEMKWLNSIGIMEIFCEIVKERDLLVAVAEDAYDDNGEVVSNGVLLEIKTAKKHKKLVLSFENVMGLS